MTYAEWKKLNQDYKEGRWGNAAVSSETKEEEVKESNSAPIKDEESTETSSESKTHTIDEVPADKREEVESKVESGEVPHNPWPEEQFKAIMANTESKEKREEYAAEQKGEDK